MTTKDKDTLAHLIIEYGDKKSHIGAYLAKGECGTSFCEMLDDKNKVLDKILRMIREC